MPLTFGNIAAVKARQQGAQHVRRGQPVQDDVLCELEELGIVFAVADGHGSSRHADVGASAAVQAAKVVLSRRLREAGSVAGLLQLSRERTCDDPLSVEVIRDIRQTWEDLLRSNDEDVGDLDDLREFGTTLITGVADEAGLLVLQVGDGDVVVASRSGVRHLLKPSALDIGDETHSLCLCPEDHVRPASLQWSEAPCLLFVSTDGYAKSYPDDESFREAAAGYLPLLKEFGAERVEEWLPAYLSRVTNEGAGDDIATVLLYRQPGSHEDTTHQTSGTDNAAPPSANDSAGREMSEERRLLTDCKADTVADSAPSPAGGEPDPHVTAFPSSSPHQQETGPDAINPVLEVDHDEDSVDPQ